MHALTINDHELIVFPQVLYEFWSSSTNSKESNGLGLSVGRTLLNLDEILLQCRVLQDDPQVVTTWIQLVSHHGIRGRAVHDAHLVASMKFHSISHILTFNGPDFASFPGITMLDPVNVTVLSQP
jgi:predicted nucleic acid-binding protein